MNIATIHFMTFELLCLIRLTARVVEVHIDAQFTPPTRQDKMVLSVSCHAV